MYYGDPYDPNEPNDYDDEFAEPEMASLAPSSHNKGTSIAASEKLRRKKRSKLLDEFKSTDKGYRKITIYEEGVKHIVDCYHTSSNPGATIRGAVSGERLTGYKVGSSDEKLFFKVGVPGLHVDGSILFFDNPEQYERHFQQSLSQDIKDKWTTSYKRENAIRIERENEKERKGITVIH